MTILAMTMRVLASTAIFFVSSAPSPAQGLPTPNVIYQQGGVIGTQSSSSGAFGFISTAFLGGSTVTGKPFSATEERHSLQVLGDGTRIESTDTDKFYRDDQGRTRTEQGSEGDNAVTIQDPVAGSLVLLDPANKTARKMPAPRGVPLALGSISAANRVEIRSQVLAAGGLSPTPGTEVLVTRKGTNLAKPSSENLGTQIVNGVPAEGTKTTITIPAGQIGNDRPISVVSERWYSTDLQMTVKSTNSDPRFGDVTFELTDINRAPPDPSLFQVPAGYTLAPKKEVEYAVPGKVVEFNGGQSRQ